MIRRGRQKHQESHERWLVSYADFITLLFAFFVVMFASANSDRAKAARVSDSVRRAFSSDQLRSMVASILGGSRADAGRGNAQRNGPGGSQKLDEELLQNASPGDLQESLRILTQELSGDLESGKVDIRLEARGLVVSLREKAFFASGLDTIEPGALPSIEKIAEVIRRIPNPVRLEGHTDSLPIRNQRFHSNWELSTARSIAMLELLTTRFGIPKNRFAVAGYADNISLAPNDSEEGRAQNRRVDVAILNASGMESEPKPARKQEAPNKPSPF